MLTVFRHYTNSVPRSKFAGELETIITYLDEKKKRGAVNSDTLELSEF